MMRVPKLKYRMQTIPFCKLFFVIRRQNRTNFVHIPIPKIKLEEC